MKVPRAWFSNHVQLTYQYTRMVCAICWRTVLLRLRVSRYPLIRAWPANTAPIDRLYVFTECTELVMQFRLYKAKQNLPSHFTGCVVCTRNTCKVRSHNINTQNRIGCVGLCATYLHLLSFNLWAPCVLYIGQAFHYSPENAFYIFNQQIYFIIWYLLDRASLI